jgi:preprotein translocase subunit YajC
LRYVFLPPFLEAHKKVTHNWKKNCNKKMILLDISNGWKTIIMIVAMIAVFYFFLIRPQSQQAKKEADYRDSLKPGDEVMTAGGIHGKVVNNTPSHITLQIAEGTQIKVARANIQPIPERKAKKRK